MTPARSSRRRQPLTRDRIVRAAVSVADREGLDALTMRRLGAELGVEAMSLYKHVANKDQILDALVEEVFGAIDTAGRDGATGGADAAPDWKAAMRVRAASARAVLCRHSWALGLLEARGSTGPAALGYVDSVLGTLRGAGFSPEDAAHAFWTLDSFVYGHVVQEVSGGAAGRTIDGDPSDYPHLAELVTYADSVGFEVDREFEFGLELILYALERTLTQH